MHDKELTWLAEHGRELHPKYNFLVICLPHSAQIFQISWIYAFVGCPLSMDEMIHPDWQLGRSRTFRYLDRSSRPHKTFTKDLQSHMTGYIRQSGM